VLAPAGICMTGGHGWWFGPTDGPDDVRKAVRESSRWAPTSSRSSRQRRHDHRRPNRSPQLTEAEIAPDRGGPQGGAPGGGHAQAAWDPRLRGPGITSIEHGVFLDQDSSRMKQTGAYSCRLIAPHAIPGGVRRPESRVMCGRRDRLEAHGRTSSSPFAAGADLGRHRCGTPLNPHGQHGPELKFMIRYGLFRWTRCARHSSAAAGARPRREVGRWLRLRRGTGGRGGDPSPTSHALAASGSCSPTANRSSPARRRRARIAADPRATSASAAPTESIAPSRRLAVRDTVKSWRPSSTPASQP